MSPISVPVPAGYVAEVIAFTNVKGLVVIEIFEALLSTTICPVSPTKALALTHPIKPLIVAPVRFKSPVEIFSILYSSVVAATATTDQPFVSLNARSFT
jgi:hypothetical protein